MRHKPLDKTGIWLAIVCALHCLLVPVLLPTLSLLGLSVLGADTLERAVLSLSALIGGVAIAIGTKHHRSPLPLLALLAGVVLYFNKHNIGHAAGHGWEIPVVLVGAGLLISAHVMNLHLCRVRRVENCDVAAEAEANPSENAAESELNPVSGSTQHTA
ncbi:MerC domain-containing protein [Aliidiomarina soli]|uniref:MerC domain-containing protein n=1 Tax=Aliidiomarina soli TaxID=1928574 RepID=A0A432WFW7_9GAMM|nr:MerC domain-containing protein [Aliidiomarina soli]RUO32631.1 MerC domain-containing protein [Aliidiomarina soli]